jgi:hypothetical protein
MLSPTKSAPPPAASGSGLLHPRFWLIALVVTGLLAVVMGRRVFDTLGLPDYGHWFLDSYAILAANDAVVAGLDPYESIPFDLLKRRHAYSTWWLHLHRLGLTRADNFLFGGACVLAFLVVALAGMRPRTRGEAVFLAALTLSPPVLLAVNRANNDLVLFALLGGTLLLLRRINPPWRTTVLAAALVVATGLKFYPAAAIAAIALLDASTRRGLRVAGVALAAAGIVLWSERASVARGGFVFPDSVYRFGSPVIWSGLGLTRGTILILSACLLGLAAWLLTRLRLTRGLREESQAMEADRWQFTLGGLLLLGCFVAGTSFAYRWVFALWLAPWLWRRAVEGPRRGVAGFALVALCISLWQDGLFCTVIHLWLPTANPSIETVWRNVTQPINWILMSLIAGWLLEATVQVFRQSDLTGGRTDRGDSAPLRTSRSPAEPRVDRI